SYYRGWAAAFFLLLSTMFLFLGLQLRRQYQTENVLLNSEIRLNKAQSLAQIGDWEIELGSKQVRASAEACRICGIVQASPDLSLQTILQVICKADISRLELSLNALLENDEMFDVEFKIHQADNGLEKSIHSIAALERGPRGIPLKITGILQDITERKRLEEALQYQATIDGLTGIFNRSHFMARANEELQRIHRYGGTCVMLMLDMDHFKLVNDSFGHAVGDTVLQRVSALSKEATRTTDLLGRIGGEEFAILLLETDIANASQIADRLRQTIQDTVFVVEEGVQMPMHVSIGVAEHCSEKEQLSELLIRADKALYRAKSEGRNRVVKAG
ncbi:MAG TPA: sensor domain-containing diguanylate cyclase, partial [Negativicutes bacterium]|nr:sensor domain-containing diguanylate cyclase [Negativicutes bacterium]